jgi:hypothetical protein
VTIAESHFTALGRIKNMLEWRPRLIALLALTALLVVAFASGYGIPFADNWEW